MKNEIAEYFEGVFKDKATEKGQDMAIVSGLFCAEQGVHVFRALADTINALDCGITDVILGFGVLFEKGYVETGPKGVLRLTDKGEKVLAAVEAEADHVLH